MLNNLIITAMTSETWRAFLNKHINTDNKRKPVVLWKNLKIGPLFVRG